MASGDGDGMQALQCVRLLTDRYKGEGVGQGAVGCILEVYDGSDGARYEVEFADEQGRTVALLVLAGEELERIAGA